MKVLMNTGSQLVVWIWNIWLMIDCVSFKTLCPHEIYGYDGLMKMLRLSAPSIFRSLALIFQNFPKLGFSPNTVQLGATHHKQIAKIFLATKSPTS